MLIACACLTCALERYRDWERRLQEKVRARLARGKAA